MAEGYLNEHIVEEEYLFNTTHPGDIPKYFAIPSWLVIGIGLFLGVLCIACLLYLCVKHMRDRASQRLEENRMDAEEQMLGK